MKHRTPFVLAILIPLLLSITVWLAPAARAESSFFSSRCASCHSNDSTTCNGCHHHRGSLGATADQPQYFPGAPVTVTLTGGTRTGWIRALLYDDHNVELARATGPTGTGDDGLGHPVAFPVALHATAPAQAGDYTWQAAWYGNLNDGGAAHGENRTTVVIHVVPNTAGMPDPEPGPSLLAATWGWIKGQFEAARR